MQKYLLLLLPLLFAACGQRKAGRDARSVITVSIAPLEYVVQAIAGPDYAVKAMMPQGASPETYEPTPRQMMELNSSVALFRIGTLGFEQTRLQSIAEQAPQIQPIDLSRGIPPVLGFSCAHHDEAEADHAHAAGDGSDPHVWMSARSMKVMAENACAALSAVDTTKTAQFTARLARFEEKMDSLDAVVRETLKGVHQRTFVIFHPALGYFARDYGLRQLSVEADGKAPSADALQQLIATARAEQVRVVFISEEHEGKTAQRVAEAIGAKVVKINPLGSDWEKEMMTVAKALAAN